MANGERIKRNHRKWLGNKSLTSSNETKDRTEIEKLITEDRKFNFYNKDEIF
jgi:hypothetical protein